MPSVAFHFNMPDKLGYACRLLRKALRQGVQVGVVGEDAQLAELDRTLWTFDPVDFVAHLRAGPDTPAAATGVAARTRLWLARQPRDLPHRAVLVNLGPDIPEGFEGFERVIELVEGGQADRLQGRQRWKHYQAAGCEIERHEVGTPA